MTAQNHPFYEILAKEIAYVFDNPKFNKPINEFLYTQGYKVDRALNTVDSKFHAFGLLPVATDKAPVLVLRGTTKAIDDIASKHPKGIGFNQFIENQDEIAAWLIDTMQKTHQKPDIVGHALGGAIAQVIATEMIEWIGEVVTFNSPGTSFEIAQQFFHNGGDKLSVTHYVIDGDIISLAGEAFIAGKAILQCFTDCVIKPVHNLDKQQKMGCLLSNPPFGFTQTEISVQALSHPAFTFFSPDYLKFLTEYYAINPEVTLYLTSRGKFEALRRSGFALEKIYV